MTTTPLPPRIETMQTRAQFLAAAAARRMGSGAMMVQARPREDGNAAIRVGFTCSKKVGNAVARNRAKRRLREVARLVLPRVGQPGWDYVLIGRRDDTAARPFEALLSDFETALARLHSGDTMPRRPKAPRRKPAKGGA